ncbi:GNAT family N-acetyltransferase [Sphingobium sp. H33]|uniref:GNAT family N-acetyltransferase n=2 Tax=Sphingobium nicotianae TaxID=2782607 RepID=A0A9X1DA63_9SPHN|nr:GNAT family N-acetyltransferase [Sphingobium nicotianae]
MRIDSITTEQAAVRDLIAIHLAGMHASSPPENVFALDLSGYAKPNLTLWGAWRGEALAGMIALQRLSATQGEIKSMRTHPDHLRLGIARLLLDHVIDVARGEGIRRLSLETGRGDAFEPALTLYRARGFVNGDAFSDYKPSDFSQFLHLDLA